MCLLNVNKTDDTLKSQCSDNQKKNAFGTSLYRGPHNFQMLLQTIQ